jgi:hypothetical protein
MTENELKAIEEEERTSTKPEHPDIVALVAEVRRLRAQLARITRCVDAQAEDEALWARPFSIVEAYTQQELRRLHHVVEGDVVPVDE